MNKKFCSICMKEVEVQKVQRIEELCVRDVKVQVELTYLIDAEGHEVDDYDVARKNDIAVFDEYRKAINFLTSTQIKAIRTKYHLSAELFAKALGMGAKSITRFENGSIQSRETNSLLILVQKPENFLKVIKINRRKLTTKEYQKCLSGYYKANPITFEESVLYQDWYEGITQLVEKSFMKLRDKGNDWELYKDNIFVSSKSIFSNEQRERSNRA